VNCSHRGPAVVTFHRGGGCPYCGIQLRAYQAILLEITELGARQVVISPQPPDGSLSTVETNVLASDVLSDLWNDVARRFELVWSPAEELRATLRPNNKALPRHQRRRQLGAASVPDLRHRPGQPHSKSCCRNRLPSIS